MTPICEFETEEITSKIEPNAIFKIGFEIGNTQIFIGLKAEMFFKDGDIFKNVIKI